MRSRPVVLFVLAPLLVLGGCRFPSLGAVLPGLGGAQANPPSPVIATVAGEKITKADLDAEIVAESPSGQAPATLDQSARDLALRGLIARRLLANAARAQGLDRTADYRETKARLEDSLLANALQDKFAATAKPPTDADVQAYMAAHPASFAARRIFGVDQMRFARPNDPALVQRMSAAASLDGLAAVLTAAHIPFQRTHVQVDGAAANPDLVEAMSKLPPGALFVLPASGLVTVNAVVGASVQPFTGAPAVAYARHILEAEARQTAVRQGLDAVFAKAAREVKTTKPYSVGNLSPSPPPPSSGPAPAPVTAPAPARAAP